VPGLRRDNDPDSPQQRWYCHRCGEFDSFAAEERLEMKARDQPSRVERPGRGAGAVSEAPPTGGRLLDSVLGRTLRGMSRVPD